MPQDEILCADRRFEDDITQGKRTEVWKAQRTEGELRQGTDIDIAMKGELREGLLRWSEENARTEGAPEVAPVIQGRV